MTNINQQYNFKTILVNIKITNKNILKVINFTFHKKKIHKVYISYII